MGLQVQQDDRGIEGVIILKDDGKKRKVRIGTKVSNERVKQNEHETGAQSRALQDSEAAKNDLLTNTKDSRALEGMEVFHVIGKLSFWIPRCGQSHQFCHVIFFSNLPMTGNPIFSTLKPAPGKGGRERSAGGTTAGGGRSRIRCWNF